MWKLVRVRGVSMSPVLGDRDLLLVRRLADASSESLRAGDIACFRHPDLGLIVKRVLERLPAPTHFRIGSENLLGSDESALGPLPASALVGRVVLRLWPRPRPFRRRGPRPGRSGA
ncbi:MAG: hypothetical protein CSA62_10970 [Planctomycetota bacterium]|nr:MAG: hypothetical protein CSA62_10970 [Planctomycetota bacterium]